MAGWTSALIDPSRTRANSSSFTGTSCTTTVYVSCAALAAGGGTNGARRTGAGILDDSAGADSATCPRESSRGASVWHALVITATPAARMMCPMMRSDTGSPCAGRLTRPAPDPLRCKRPGLDEAGDAPSIGPAARLPRACLPLPFRGEDAAAMRASAESGARAFRRRIRARGRVDYRPLRCRPRACLDVGSGLVPVSVSGEPGSGAAACRPVLAYRRRIERPGRQYQYSPW